MSTLEIILIICSSLLAIFLLLLAGVYYKINFNAKTLSKQWDMLLKNIQYYCDNIPYAVESYRLLNAKDIEVVHYIIDLKNKCLNEKKNGNNLASIYFELQQAMIRLFDYRYKSREAAHDIRFVESYTEFKELNSEILFVINLYEELLVEYETSLKRILGRILKFLFDFPTFNHFKK